MTTNIFTKEFYSKLSDAIIEKGGDADYEKLCEHESVSVCCYVDNMYIEAEVVYGTTWCDDSFDHAFGTWHDTCAHYEAEGIDELEDITVYENDDCEKVIDGFSYDDFWAQFEQDTYILVTAKGNAKKVTEGDKIYYCGEEVEFLAYNGMKSMCKIRRANGNTQYAYISHLKAKEAVSAA